MYCGNCGVKNNDESIFCYSCGNKLQGTKDEGNTSKPEVASDIVENQEVTSVVATNSSAEKIKEKMPSSKKTPMIILAIVLALLIPAVIFFVNSIGIVSGNQTLSPIIYMKNNEMLARDTKAESSLSISDKIFNNEEMLMEATYYYDFFFGGVNDLGLAKVANEGNSLLFINEIEDNNGIPEGNLYLRNISEDASKDEGSNEHGVRIASRVAPYFSVASNGKYVAYLKNFNTEEHGSLYVNDFEKETKIANDIDDFLLSQDGNYIIYGRYNYETYDREYYIKSLNDDTYDEKIDSSITRLEKITPNFDKIYYTKANGDGTESLYLKEIKKDKEKLVGDANSIFSIQEDGSVIYSKHYSEQFDLKNILNDDMLTTDASITMPYEDDYILYYEEYYYYSYPVYDEEKYSIDLERYYEKQDRDSIREYVRDNPIEITKKDLYVFKEGKSEKIAGDVSEVLSASDKGDIAYFKHKEGSIDKVNISDVSYGYEVTDHYWNNSNQRNDLYRYTTDEGNKLILSKDEYNRLTFSEDLKSLYLIEDFNYDRYIGTFVKYDLSDMENKEVIAEDVSSFTLYSNSDVVYFKDLRDDVGELYLKNGKRNEKVADDVYSYGYFYDEENELIVCLDRYNYTDVKGRLITISNFETKVIEDDVNTFYYLEADDILFLKEYRESKKDAELWHHDGDEENLRLDYDVTNILYY